MCANGWHQVCHNPPVAEEVVDSRLAWHCKTCDIKIASKRPPVDVSQGSWTAGSPPYTVAEKTEWLEGLPLHSLIGFILSVESGS